jgi:hypothetical protein
MVCTEIRGAFLYSTFLASTSNKPRGVMMDLALVLGGLGVLLIIGSIAAFFAATGDGAVLFFTGVSLIVAALAFNEIHNQHKLPGQAPWQLSVATPQDTKESITGGPRFPGEVVEALARIVITLPPSLSPTPLR